MRVAVVNLTGGGFSGGYRKYLDRLVPLLRNDERVQALEVYGPGTERAEIAPFAPDVVFIPTARWLDMDGVPVVPMVRNMEPLTVPFGGNGAMETVRNLARAREARKACFRSKRVIAVSAYVREFLVETWAIDSAKIGVVEHGVEAPMAREDSVRPAALPAHLEPGFLFTAGSLRPARGLEDAIRALRLLHRRRSGTTLVVAGSPVRGTGGYERRMRRLAHRCADRGQVVFAGQLSAGEMSWCYHHCRAVVLTSRAEACPNVLLEAMAHGCLCISVDRPPMSEMVGSEGLHYVAGDAVDLARQVDAAVGMDAATKEHLRQMTLERAKRWDWDRTAEETVDQLVLAVR